MKDTNNFGTGRSIGAVLAVVHPEHYDDFIFNSFYLPQEVLCSNEYQISKIQVLTGTEFGKLMETTYKDCKYVEYEGCTEELVRVAWYVGVSARYHKKLRSNIIVVKLWYGSVPSLLPKTNYVLKVAA